MYDMAMKIMAHMLETDDGRIDFLKDGSDGVRDEVGTRDGTSGVRGAGRAARVRDAEEPGDLVVRVPDGLVEARREDAEARGGGREQEEGVAARDEDGEKREFGDFGGRGGQEGRERVRLL